MAVSEGNRDEYAQSDPRVSGLEADIRHLDKSLREFVQSVKGSLSQLEMLIRETRDRTNRPTNLYALFGTAGTLAGVVLAVGMAWTGVTQDPIKERVAALEIEREQTRQWRRELSEQAGYQRRVTEEFDVVQSAVRTLMISDAAMDQRLIDLESRTRLMDTHGLRRAAGQSVGPQSE